MGVAHPVPHGHSDGNHRWYIRRAISDTPNFERLKESGGLSRNPLKEAFSTPEHRRAMILALFIPLMNGSGYYVLFSYMPTFLKGDQIGFSTGTALLVTASSLVAICFAIPFMVLSPTGSVARRSSPVQLRQWRSERSPAMP